MQVVRVQGTVPLIPLFTSSTRERWTLLGNYSSNVGNCTFQRWKYNHGNKFKEVWLWLFGDVLTEVSHYIKHTDDDVLRLYVNDDTWTTRHGPRVQEDERPVVVKIVKIKTTIRDCHRGRVNYMRRTIVERSEKTETYSRSVTQEPLYDSSDSDDSMTY